MYATPLKVVEQRAVSGYSEDPVKPIDQELGGAGEHKYSADDKPDAAENGKPLGKTADAGEKYGGLRHNERGQQKRHREPERENRQQKRAVVHRRGVGGDEEHCP